MNDDAQIEIPNRRRSDEFQEGDLDRPAEVDGCRYSLQTCWSLCGAMACDGRVEELM